MDPVNKKVIVEQLEAVFAGLSLTDGPEVEMSTAQVEELDFESLEGLFHAMMVCTNDFTSPFPPSLRAKAVAACDHWLAIAYTRDRDAFVCAMAEARRRVAAKKRSRGAAAMSGGAAASSSISAASSSISAASSSVSG
ncbi:hypothetical protein OROGR_032196 [Orobanche gracilis]